MALRPNQKDFKNTFVLAGVFVFAGLSCVPGFYYIFFFLDSKYVHSVMGVGMYFKAGGASYIGGAIIYALRWPEKNYKGVFDYFGNSHQIFHVCVLVGALLHMYGTIRVFHERLLYPCPADF